MFDASINPTEMRPKNFGPMRDASSRAKYKGPCGDLVEIWLRIDGGKIRKASYITSGCDYSNACCSAAAKLVEGMTPDEAKNITQAAILKKVGPVPEDHRHCALLAATVIQMAISNYLENPAKPSLKQKLKHLFKSKTPEKNHV